MGKSTIESRTLQRAVEILGGRLKLAKRLQAPLLELDRWLAGEERPPHIFFLRAVDVVLYQDVIEPSEPGEIRPWNAPSGSKPDQSSDGNPEG